MRRAACASPISPRLVHDQAKSALKAVNPTRKLVKSGTNSVPTDANSFLFIDDPSRYIEIYRRSKLTYVTETPQRLPPRRNPHDAPLPLPKVTCYAPIPGAAAMYRPPQVQPEPPAVVPIQQEPPREQLPAHDINLSPICQKLNTRIEPLPRKYSVSAVGRPPPTADRGEALPNNPPHWAYAKTKKLRLRVSTAEYVDFIGDLDRLEQSRQGTRSDPLSSAHGRLCPPSE